MTVEPNVTRTDGDADPVLPVCALCGVPSAAWFVGPLVFCVTCEAAFGLDGCLSRARLAAVAVEVSPNDSRR